MCNQPIGRQGVVQKISCNSAEEERGEAETLTLRPRRLRRRMDSPPHQHQAQLRQTQTQDEGQKVKFLCSFGGSIMPRPQDGKLRYVGGETRIVSLPRDTNYEELIAKMRELFDGAMVLKYQQPDEDLDALVSVVNDDDVTNMMEEYDKLGAGDGFTRLRMFLFPHPDHDFASSSPHFESDERESERRYIDALNSLNDCGGLEFRLQQSPDSPGIEPMNNPMSVEFGRNFEMPISQFNLRQLRIPHLGGQHQQPHAQRYSEMEAPWSPAYYSPRHHGHHDGRPVTEYTLSPSSGRYRVGYGEAQSPFTENVVWLPAAPVPNDNSGFPVNLGHLHNVFEGNSICEHCRMGFHRNPSLVDPTCYSDPRWLAGTPAQPHMDGGNEFHQFSGPCSACNSGREAHVFNPDANLEHGVYAKEQSDPRNFYNEAHERGWAMHHPHMNHQVEEPRISMPMPGTTWINEQHVVDGVGVNGPIAQVNIGVNGSIAQGNIDVNGSIAQGNTGVNGSVAQGNIGVNGSIAQGNIGINGIAQGNIGVNGVAQGNITMNGSIALGDNGVNGSIAQGNIGVNGVAQGNIGVNGRIPHGNIGVNGLIAQGDIGVNGPIAHGNCIKHDDPRCIPVGPELGEHAVVAGPHGPIPPVDERGICYGKFPAAYGTDNAYQLPQGPAPAHALWIKMQNPMRHSPSYEALSMLPQANGTVNSGFLQSFREGSPSFHVGLDNPNAWAGQSHKICAVNGPSFPEYPHGCVPPMVNSNMPLHENPNLFTPDPSLPPGGMTTFVETAPMVSAIDDKLLTSTTPGYIPGPTDAVGEMRLEEKTMLEEGTKVKMVQTVEGSHIPDESTTDKSEVVVEETNESVPEANELKPAEEEGDATKLIETDGPATLEAHAVLVENLSFLPELIASVKQAALEGAEQMKATVQGNIERDVVSTSEKAATQDLDPENADVDVEDESEGDHQEAFGIEQTKAEAEALDKGLQTIKNDDLEEIRELGSGTYGSVYHGKWKGSDVAIKRIKASCFAGRPSERERLIADFWKEALILSSLHHPNVVSFYGIVRDGPDGSLATVTEFMINGSLKQFLQKKDRTIDRRKRLLLAMDTAFGMEYLHGKNIVHFDLKCENLLVNMRDPHRPICKIGDLGLSKVKQHTLVSGGVRGTLPWMAPELLSGKSNMVTEKIDVYSYGIVMWEMLKGEEPYADMHCASIIGGIVNNSLRPQIPSWCDPEWKSLMESCWSGEPGERPSFSEISQKLRKMAAAINLK